jgi:hypothetical protein
MVASFRRRQSAAAQVRTDARQLRPQLFDLDPEEWRRADRYRPLAARNAADADGSGAKMARDPEQLWPDLANQRTRRTTTEPAALQDFSERMKGLEPSTFCMATRPDTPILIQQPHG